jgi:drug/metabolite transporter (DMT)-like permease
MSVHLALLLVQILFGLWPVAGAAVLTLMDPPALIGFRLMLGAPLLALVARLFTERPPARADLLRLAVLGGLGISINQLFFAEGLARAGPVNASLSILLLPAITLVIAVLARLERPRPLQLVGVVIAFAGAALLLKIERLDLRDRVVVGNLMLLANTTAYALYIVGARPVVTRLGTLRTMAWVFVFGAIEAAPLTVPAILRVHWLSLPPWAIGALAFILFGATLATYLLNAYALKRVESSTVAVYVYVQPVVASLAGWAFLRVLPTARTLIAGAVIVVGVALSTDLVRTLRRSFRSV